VDTNTRAAQGLTRPMAILIAALVISFTLASMKRAYAATTVPNASKITVTLGSGADSGFYSFPTSKAPFILMGGVGSAGGYLGAGHAVCDYNNTSGYNYFSWNSNDAPSSYSTSPAETKEGYTYPGDSSGRNFLTIAYANYAYLKTAFDGSGNPSGFRVHNDWGSSATYVILEIW